jgi:outer membrane protein assembly factor BamB
MKPSIPSALLLACAACAGRGTSVREEWLSWRGPEQVGRSVEAGLPDAIDPEQPLWSVPISGRGTPVIAGGRVYVMGYVGEGDTLRELMVCLDERSGRVLWQKRVRDLFTDTVYSRYSISSPTVDPETGNVYFQTTGGLLVASTRDGEELWRHSLIEEYGKLTFPNGRTGAPLVDEDRVIVHIVSVTWGPLAPARDRFYAFDKRTGACLWVCTPGEVPIDNSFSMPYVEERGGRRVLYAETGCGHVVCIDTRTGDGLWRFRMATGAANSSVVVEGDTLVAVHGGENLDSSTQGRMVALRIPPDPAPGPKGIVELDPSAELWRVDLEAFSSSPVLAEGRVYLTDEDGELACVDATSGALLWKHKLAADQVHASPLFADGKLYAPMNNGSFHVLRPRDGGPEVLSKAQLAGNCLGQPAASGGRLYVHTTERLYCFGAGGELEDGARKAVPASAPAASSAAKPGPPVRIQVVPADATLRVGEAVPFRVRALDAGGRVVSELAPESAEFERPGVVDLALLGVVRATRPAAGVLAVKAGGFEASARLRFVPGLPFTEDFEGVPLDQERAGAKTGRCPGGWFGGVAKWEVREKDGSKVLARIMDNPLFQRTISLLGHPADRDYTMRVDVCVAGNRRSMASVGVIHQRYLIELKGNYQEIEVSSNVESLKVSAHCEIQPETWYRLMTRVERLPDGSGVVRAKVWPRGEPEPAAWTIEVPHADVHQSGAAGIYGFTPMSRFEAFLDNLTITPDDPR